MTCHFLGQNRLLSPVMPRHAYWAPAQPRCRALGARSTRGARLGPKQVSQCPCVAQRATGPSGSPSPSSCRQKAARRRAMRLTLSSKWLRRSEAGQTSKSSWYCGCSGPSRLSLMPETTSQTGGSGVSLLQVPLCHEHLEAHGRCRTVVTRPVRAARLHVRVLDVLPHGWYRQTSCRWPRATEGHWCL